MSVIENVVDFLVDEVVLAAPIPVIGSYLLKEDGSYLLQEDGSKILLE